MPPTCDACGSETGRVFQHGTDKRTEWQCARCHPEVEGIEYL